MGLFDAIGGVLGTDKTDEAISAQQSAADQSNATLKSIYDQQRADLTPYRTAGESALTQMQDPSFQKSFTLADFNADPGYQFRLDQGQKALERSAAARGMNLSGAQTKALTDYGQGMGSQEYGAAYDRFNNDQNTRFGRLATLSGYGLSAAGMNNANLQNYGNNVAQTQMGVGNAEAGAQMAQGNQNAQMFNGMVNGAATVLGGPAGAKIFCDERLKCDIRAVSKEDMAELKRTIRPYFFKYKNPKKHGQGEYLGVMTKDLKRSKLGSALVTTDEEGNECIDLHRLLMLFLASQAEG